LLNYWGLGTERILKEIEEGLHAVAPKYFKDELLAYHEDSYRRTKCLEYLIDLHGKRKVNIEHEGSILHTFIDLVKAAQEEDAGNGDDNTESDSGSVQE